MLITPAIIKNTPKEQQQRQLQRLIQVSTTHLQIYDVDIDTIQVPEYVETLTLKNVTTNHLTLPPNLQRLILTNISSIKTIIVPCTPSSIELINTPLPILNAFTLTHTQVDIIAPVVGVIPPIQINKITIKSCSDLTPFKNLHADRCWIHRTNQPIKNLPQLLTNKNIKKLYYFDNVAVRYVTAINTLLDQYHPITSPSKMFKFKKALEQYNNGRFDL